MPILNEYDETRYTAPPEPTEEHHEEPEDHIDWVEKNFPEPESLTPQGDFGKMHER